MGVSAVAALRSTIVAAAPVETTAPAKAPVIDRFERAGSTPARIARPISSEKDLRALIVDVTRLRLALDERLDRAQVITREQTARLRGELKGSLSGKLESLNAIRQILGAGVGASVGARAAALAGWPTLLTSLLGAGVGASLSDQADTGISGSLSGEISGEAFTRHRQAQLFTFIVVDKARLAALRSEAQPAGASPQQREILDVYGALADMPMALSIDEANALVADARELKAKLRLLREANVRLSSPAQPQFAAVEALVREHTEFLATSTVRLVRAPDLVVADSRWTLLSVPEDRLVRFEYALGDCGNYQHPFAVGADAKAWASECPEVGLFSGSEVKDKGLQCLASARSRLRETLSKEWPLGTACSAASLPPGWAAQCAAVAKREITLAIAPATTSGSVMMSTDPRTKPVPVRTSGDAATDLARAFSEHTHVEIEAFLLYVPEREVR